MLTLTKPWGTNPTGPYRKRPVVPHQAAFPANRPYVLDQSRTGNPGTSTSYTVPIPSASGVPLATNHLVVVAFVSNAAATNTITPPDASWFALVAPGLISSVGYAVYWHQVTSAEAASPPNGWTFTLGTAEAASWVALRVGGADPGTPFDTAVSSVTSGTSTRVIPSVTTVTDYALLIGGANLQSASSGVIKCPTTWSQDESTCGFGWGRGQIINHRPLWGAGDTGTQTFTASSPLSGLGWMIAVRPNASTALAPADTGAGTDTLSSTTALPLADTGSGADTLTLATTLTLTDTGGAGDALGVTTTRTIGDTGSGVDAVAVAVAIALADTGTGTDAMTPSAGGTSVSPADAGSGAEALAVTTSTTRADTGTGTDALALTVAESLSDTGLGVEAMTRAVSLPLADTGTAAEMLSITAAVGLTDSGVGSDMALVSSGLRDITVTTRSVPRSWSARDSSRSWSGNDSLRGWKGKNA